MIAATCFVRADYQYLATASTASSVYTDYDTFMNAADGMHDAALLTLLAGGSDVASDNLKVRAGVELVSSGDMTVDSNWDLTNANWLRTGANQTAGRLALRAAGNLTVNARLGLPNESALPPDSGWSLQLAAGADTASADALAVTASTAQGDVTLGSARQNHHQHRRHPDRRRPRFQRRQPGIGGLHHRARSGASHHGTLRT